MATYGIGGSIPVFATLEDGKDTIDKLDTIEEEVTALQTVLGPLYAAAAPTFATRFLAQLAGSGTGSNGQHLLDGSLALAVSTNDYAGDIVFGISAAITVPSSGAWSSATTITVGTGFFATTGDDVERQAIIVSPIVTAWDVLDHEAEFQQAISNVTANAFDVQFRGGKNGTAGLTSNATAVAHWVALKSRDTYS